MEIRVRGIEKFKESLDKHIQERIPAIISKALNYTGQGAVQALKHEISDSFDAPVPYLLRAPDFEGANKHKLSIRMFISFVDPGKGGLSPSDVLSPHVKGGGRSVKSSERRLRRLGLMGQNQYITPSKYVPKDKYGNVSSGTMVKILAQARAFSEAGFNANAKLVGMTWKRYADLGSIYVVRYVGIFGRRGGSKTGVPLLFFTHKKPAYEAERFDFAFTVRNYFKNNFSKNVGRAQG